VALATLEYGPTCIQWFIGRRRDNSIRSGRSTVYHPSVRLWMIYARPDVRPPALKVLKLVYDTTRTRCAWVKEWTDANIGEVRRVT